MKLGCMNHSILTAEVIQNAGVDHLGWIANQVDLEMMFYPETRQTLDQYLSTKLGLPCIGESLWQQSLVFNEPEAFVQGLKERFINV